MPNRSGFYVPAAPAAITVGRFRPPIVAGGSQVESLIDVLNALDDHAEERLADSNRFSQNFGRPSAFMDPRRAMIAARVTLPR